MRAEDLQVAAGRRRAVGQDEIDVMQRQFGQQGFETALAADQAHVFRHRQHGFQQLIGEQLGNAIGNAGAQAQHVAAVGCPHRFLERFAKLEDLVGVTERHASGVAQGKAASLADEQRLAQIALEQRKLAADRLHRHAEALGGARHAAFVRDDPEIMQVLVVQVGHKLSEKTEM